MKHLALIILLMYAGSAHAAVKTIKIGIASNFSVISESSSNPYGNYFRNGIKLALREQAPALKRAGINIELVEFDYGDRTYEVASIPEKACKSDIVTMLGYVYSDHALVAAPAHQKCGLPMLTSSATADRLGKMGKYIHQATFDNSFQGEVLAKFTRSDLKAKTASIVAIANCAYCTDLAAAFKTLFVKLGGEVVSEHYVLEEDKLKSVVATIKLKNPDVVLVPNHEIQSAQTVHSLITEGITKTFLGGDGWGNTGGVFLRVIGNQPFHAYSLSHWVHTVDTKVSRDFTARYSQAFKQTPNDTAVLSYDAANLLVRNILSTKDHSREGIEKTFHQMKPFAGVTGKFIFRANRAPQKSIVLMKIAPGTYQYERSINPET